MRTSIAKSEGPRVQAMLARLDTVRALIQEGSLQDVLEVKSQADALLKYVNSHDKNSAASLELSEIAVTSAIRAGELLRGMEKAKGGQPYQSHKATGTAPTLAELGITKSQASRWQNVSRINPSTLKHHIETHREKRKHLTLKSLYRLLPKKNGKTEDPGGESRIVQSLDELDGEAFATIYADPPWSYGNQATRAATDNHYTTMTVDDIASMPVQKLADKNSQLHLWTTNGFLQEAFYVMESWGFSYKSCFVWCKPSMGIGNYWRVSHEFLLCGTRGSATFQNKGLKSWAELPRLKHSAKPKSVREMVEKAWVGPRLELFGRVGAEGWTVMGNEVARTLYT